MLDESCANTGYRLPPQACSAAAERAATRSGAPGRAPPTRRPTSDKALVSVLNAIWRAAGYPWLVRLKALVPL
jgi:hypothetical protein